MPDAAHRPGPPHRHPGPEQRPRPGAGRHRHLPVGQRRPHLPRALAAARRSGSPTTTARSTSSTASARTARNWRTWASRRATSRSRASLMTIASDGGATAGVDVGAGHCDGPEYSPDGKWLYLNTESFTLGTRPRPTRPCAGGRKRIRAAPRIRHRRLVPAPLPRRPLRHATSASPAARWATPRTCRSTSCLSPPTTGPHRCTRGRSSAAKVPSTSTAGRPDSARFAFVAYPLTDSETQRTRRDPPPQRHVRRTHPLGNPRHRIHRRAANAGPERERLHGAGRGFPHPGIEQGVRRASTAFPPRMAATKHWLRTPTWTSSTSPRRTRSTMRTRCWPSTPGSTCWWRRRSP